MIAESAKGLLKILPSLVRWSRILRIFLAISVLYAFYALTTPITSNLLFVGLIIVSGSIIAADAFARAQSRGQRLYEDLSDALTAENVSPHLVLEYRECIRSYVQIAHLPLASHSSGPILYILAIAALVGFGLIAAQSAKTAKLETLQQELKTTLDEARKNLDRNRLESELLATATFAVIDDRKALDQLQKWAEDKSYPLTERASAAWRYAVEQHNSIIVREPSKIEWKPGVKPDEVPTQQLLAESKTLSPYIREGVINFIATRKLDSKRMKLELLLEIIKNDPSLRVVERACREFNSLASTSFPLCVVDPYIKWFNENKENIK